MSRIKFLLLAAALWAVSISPSFATSSNVNGLTASGAVVGSQLFYCPIGASTDLKCTATQLGAFAYSLMNGDCTASGVGVTTCTKTNGVTFGGLAVLAGLHAGDISYWNGSSWALLTGNSSTQEYLAETSGVPSWTQITGTSITAVAKSSAYTITSADLGKLFEVTGTSTITLPALSVGAGFNSGVMNANATGGGTVTVTASAGNINSGGVSAGSVTLTPGQTMVYTINAAVSGWDGSTGPAGPTGATGAAGAGTNQYGPGYVAGPWYLQLGAPSYNNTNFGVASITTAYCSPLWFNNIGPSGGSGTIADIGFHQAVAGTTTTQAAIYTNDATQIPNRPLTLAAASTAISNTAGVSIIILPLSASLSANTQYWVCLQAGDTASFRYLSYNTIATSPLSPYLSLIGAASSAGAGTGSTTPTGVHTTSGITSYGTWPSFSGAAWTEDTQGPWFTFKFASIP